MRHIASQTTEVESRTQGSRPRTQKNPRPRTALSRTDPLARPRTGILEAKDQEHRSKCSPKKRSSKIFRRSPIEESKKRSSQIFREVSGVFQQNFNGSKNSAVLKPRAGQFSRTLGFEAKAKDFKMCPRGLHLCQAMLGLNEMSLDQAHKLKDFATGYLDCLISSVS